MHSYDSRVCRYTTACVILLIARAICCSICRPPQTPPRHHSLFASINPACSVISALLIIRSVSRFLGPFSVAFVTKQHAVLILLPIDINRPRLPSLLQAICSAQTLRLFDRPPIQRAASGRLQRKSKMSRLLTYRRKPAFANRPIRIPRRPAAGSSESLFVYQNRIIARDGLLRCRLKTKQTHADGMRPVIAVRSTKTVVPHLHTAHPKSPPVRCNISSR